MKRLIKYLSIFVLVILFWSSNFNSNKYLLAQEKAEEENYSVETAKNGIVEILCGLKLDDGSFKCIKTSCGFIVNNSESSTYIVAPYHSVTLTKKEKKKYCKKNKISLDSFNISDEIRAVVKGDVTTSIRIEAESKESDFCILSTSDVLQEKSVLRFGDTSNLSIGDNIYTLGFPDIDDKVKNMQYVSDEVEIHLGQIQDTAALMSKVPYIQHSAVITNANSGGALLSEDGYIIGMNNSSVKKKKVVAYYSLPVDEIINVLDNYGISYESKKRDEALTSLKEIYANSEKIIAGNKYKKNSMTALQEAVEKSKEILKQEYIDLGQITETREMLETAISELVEKTPKTTIYKIVFAVILLIVFIAFILLYIFVYRKDKENERGSKKNKVKKHDMDILDERLGMNTQYENNMFQGENVPHENYMFQDNNIMQENPMFQDNNISQENIMGQYPINDGGLNYMQDGMQQFDNGFQDRMASNAGYSTAEASPNMNRAVFSNNAQKLGEVNKTVILREYSVSPVHDGISSSDIFRMRKNSAHLVNKRTHQVVFIDKPDFIIGKSPEKADYVIQDNKVISRQHAAIYWSSDRYVICDLDSVNGTFVNGRKIDSQGVELSNHDEVVLANESFEFIENND